MLRRDPRRNQEGNGGGRTERGEDGRWGNNVGPVLAEPDPAGDWREYTSELVPTVGSAMGPHAPGHHCLRVTPGALIPRPS